MKKLMFIGAIALGMMSIISCEKEAEVIGTGILKVETVVEAGGNIEYGKKSGDILRGNVPVYVKGVKVSISNAGYTDSGDFMYVADGPDVASDIQFENVPNTGTVNISGKSIPADDSNQPIKFFELANRDLVDDSGSDGVRNALLTEITAKYNIQSGVIQPYAVYRGLGAINMVPGADNSTSITMNTLNGRDFGTVVNNSVYKVRVTMIDNTAGNTDTFVGVLEPNDLKTLAYYWGNEYAKEGVRGIKFKFEWIDAQGVIVKTSNEWRIIARHNESYWARISITNSGIINETIASTFIYTPIDEIGGNTDI